MIDARRQNKLENGDLISLLLQAQEGGGITDQQVRDEAMTLFLTAFDTTSTALTWVWYLLSQNPEAEAALHEELDRVLNGRIPTDEDIPQLKYARMVFSESLRLCPPSYVIPRQASENITMGQFNIPKGTIILVSPYLIHHDARFYEDPEIFNPSRWEKPSKEVNAKYEFFPFSRGPRACIGEPFAWMEAILVIATIAQFWKLKLVPGHPVEFLQQINLRPKYGILMEAGKRKSPIDN
jgi:cytochrome P450